MYVMAGWYATFENKLVSHHRMSAISSYHHYRMLEVDMLSICTY
jgi:hypothetical protein